MADLMASKDLNQQEVFALIRDLVRATNSGAAQWQQAENAPDFFYLETPGGTVNIESQGQEDHPFVFRVFDDQGRQMYELRTEVAPFYSPDEERVAELFAAARGSIYDVSGTVRKIRQSLGL